MTKTIIKSLIVIVIILSIDFFSKLWIHDHIPFSPAGMYQRNYEEFVVWKGFLGTDFFITQQINRGAAYGMFADFQVPLVALRISLIIGMCVYLLFFNKQPIQIIPFAMIIAGALGNVIDYYIYGYVIDMFHFILWGYDFPVFNVADIAISVGIFWLFILTAIT